MSVIGCGLKGDDLLVYKEVMNLLVHTSREHGGSRVAALVALLVKAKIITYKNLPKGVECE